MAILSGHAKKFHEKSFRQRLRSNPIETLTNEMGYDRVQLADMQIVVKTNTKAVNYIVIPVDISNLDSGTIADIQAGVKVSTAGTAGTAASLGTLGSACTTASTASCIGTIGTAGSAA